jgi:MFS family permease
MDVLVIVGFILAVINPVIGGVLVGYIVWLQEPVTGFQIIFLSLVMMSLYLIGFIVWAVKKFRKIAKRLQLLEGKT